jgi:hypothetical protein
MLTVSSVVGLQGIPSSKRGFRDWLARQALPVTMDGNRFTFHLSDLPAPVRRAYVEREIASMGLPQGTYDEAAHADFATLPETMRAGRNARRKSHGCWCLRARGSRGQTRLRWSRASSVMMGYQRRL